MQMGRAAYGFPFGGVLRHALVVGGLCWTGGLAGRWLIPGLRFGWIALAVGVITHFGILLVALTTFLGWVIRMSRARDCRRLLDEVSWRGDERVLDVGCGKGFVTVAAALRVPHGSVVGLDDFRRGHGASRHSAEVARANAEADGVVRRVEIRTGPFTCLGVEEYDVVLASFSLHHLGAASRLETLAAMVRATKSGGRILIVDLIGHPAITEELLLLGMRDVRLVRRTHPKILFGWVLAEKP